MATKTKPKAKTATPATWQVDYEQAIALKDERKFVEAVQILQKIMSHNEFERSSPKLGMIRQELGHIYFHIKDYKHAFELYYDALNAYLDNELYDEVFQTYTQIGSFHQSIWQFKKAIDTYQQALNLAMRLGKIDKIIEFELNIGNTYNWDNQLDIAEKYLKSVLDKEHNIQDKNIQLRAHGSYAILCRKLKRYDMAEIYFQKALELSKTLNDVMQMDMKKSYGIMQYELGNIDVAEKLLLESIDIAEKDSRESTKAVIYEYMAMLYRDKKDFEKALEYTDKFYTTKISNLEIGYSDENNILQAKMGLEEARREKRFAEEAMQMKSMFIASISHEIRTPMNIIIGTSSLMMNDNPKKEHVKYLQVLKRSSENLLGIINDILDISKIEAGKFDIDMEPVLISEVLEDVHSVLRQIAADKGIQIDYDVDPRINFAFYSDPLRLTQILTNLIGNSIKFTTEGGIQTHVGLKTKKILEIIVKDTGIGIPKDKLPHVFEHYEQVKNQAQHKYKGTGLGLSISKKLVEMMNGTITVKSKVNEGTSFIIKFPFVKAESAKKQSALLADLNADFLSGKSVLVVDDTEENRFITIETLKYFNNEVRFSEALNGKHALEILEKESHDVVLMDLDMPVMNGFEALAAIRKNKKTKDQKVIATTASLLANGDEEFLELGFNAFLPKPFEPDKFLEILRQQIS